MGSLTGFSTVLCDGDVQRDPMADAARGFLVGLLVLSRGVAGVRGKTLIVNLPGSKNGVRESLDALFPYVLHAFKILRGSGHAVQQTSLAGDATVLRPDIETHRYRSPDIPNFRL